MTRRIVELGTKAIPPSQYAYDFSFPRSAGKPNPHLWTDPRYALKYAAIIRDTLAASDPADAALLQAQLHPIQERRSTPSTRLWRASFATIPRARSASC